MERRHGGAQPPENAADTAQPPENMSDTTQPPENRDDTAQPPENAAAQSPESNAGGQAAQVRSPLYTRARLSGGFFSAVVVGMLLVNCVFSLTVVLIARAQGVGTAVITGSETVRYLSYLLYQLLYLGALAAVVVFYKEKPRGFG